MNAKIPFDPKNYTEATLRMIMAKAESAGCSPSQAVRLLLDELATQAGFDPQKKEAA